MSKLEYPLTEGQRERIKLFATYLNNVAVLFAGAAGLAPYFALASQGGLSDAQLLVYGGIVALVFVVSFGLHTLASLTLLRLDPPARS